MENFWLSPTSLPPDLFPAVPLFPTVCIGKEPVIPFQPPSFASAFSAGRHDLQSGRKCFKCSCCLLDPHRQYKELCSIHAVEMFAPPARLMEKVYVLQRLGVHFLVTNISKKVIIGTWNGKTCVIPSSYQQFSFTQFRQSISQTTCLDYRVCEFLAMYKTRFKTCFSQNAMTERIKIRRQLELFW